MAKYFLERIPLPNRGGRELNFVGTEQIETENQFMTKVEYNRNGHQISGRYFFTDYDRPAVIPRTTSSRPASAGNAVRVQNVSVNHTFSIRPTLLLTSTFGFNRQRGGSLSSGPFSYPDAGVRIASAASSALKAPPEIVMSVTGAIQHQHESSRRFRSRRLHHPREPDRRPRAARDALRRRSGAPLQPHHQHVPHGRKFHVQRQSVGRRAGGLPAGTRVDASCRAAGEFKDLKGTRWGFFAQDNWRVNQRLTLNLGVRWDPYFPYYDREGRVVCFQPGAKSQRYPNAPAGVLYGGDNHDPGCPVGGSDANVWNIAPRIGFAYRLTEDGKTSLRGGFGHFYTPIQASAFNPFTNIAPFAPGFSFDGVSFEDPFGSAGVPNPFPEQYGPRVPGAGSHVRHADRTAGRLRPGLPHAAARLVEPVAGAPDWYRLGVPRRVHRQQGQLLLRRRREQP